MYVCLYVCLQEDDWSGAMDIFIGICYTQVSPYTTFILFIPFL
jgi:hypothetical protein